MCALFGRAALNLTCLSAAGMGRFLSGITDEMKQSHREKLFAVDQKSLVDVAERYMFDMLVRLLLQIKVKTRCLLFVLQVPQCRSEDVWRCHPGPRERYDQKRSFVDLKIIFCRYFMTEHFS